MRKDGSNDMVCFKPLQAISSPNRYSPGKKKVSIISSKANALDSYAFNLCLDPSQEELTLPCGQCVGCRLARSKDWAMRCVHEASLYPDNCFITLTYNDDNLPPFGSLDKRHFQLFMKRLRFQYGSDIRFFHCGEYGDKFSRPHFHALLFNFDFEDKKHFRTVAGNKLYTSASLSRLWPFGFSTIGSATVQSAGYVARYCLKKITGDAADDHYKFVDEDTGLIFTRSPEYTTMSRSPGIARGWIDLFKSDVFPHDYVVLEGKKHKVPRYYDKLFEIEYPSDYKKIKDTRLDKALKHSSDQTTDRLLVREAVQIDKLTRLKREFEK